MTDIEQALSYAAEHSRDPSLSKHVHVYWLAVLANENESIKQRLIRYVRQYGPEPDPNSRCPYCKGTGKQQP